MRAVESVLYCSYIQYSTAKSTSEEEKVATLNRYRSVALAPKTEKHRHFMVEKTMRNAPNVPRMVTSTVKHGQIYYYVHDSVITLL